MELEDVILLESPKKLDSPFPKRFTRISSVACKYLVSPLTFSICLKSSKSFVAYFLHCNAAWLRKRMTVRT